MKLVITILAVTCTSALLCSETSAQGQKSRTYTGTNAPPAGRVAPIPDEFLVNAYGGLNEFAIEVMSPGQCDRPFYFTGTVSFQPNQIKGSIGGPMLRCTTKELKAACAKVGITLTDSYEVGFTGTIERSLDHSAYLIKITYPYVYWVKEDCTEKREAEGTETIMLFYRPPAPPPPTTKEKLDRAERNVMHTLYKSFRGGEWLKRQ